MITLDELNLQYTLNGSGKATGQNPAPGEKISGEVNIVVDFSN
jgi:hypothetical protein